MNNEEMKVDKRNEKFSVQFNVEEIEMIEAAFGEEIAEYFDLLGIQVTRGMTIRYAIKQALKAKKAEVLR